MRAPPAMGIGLPVAAQSNSSAEKWNQISARAKCEGAGVLQEKVSLFRKEQIEPREIDLLLVDFNLSKIRVVSCIKSDRWRQPVLEIQTASHSPSTPSAIESWSFVRALFGLASLPP